MLTDSVTGNPNGTLRDAISAANTDTGTATDTIQLAAGTYTLTIPNSGNQHEQKNASGDLNITSTSHDLVIEGATDASGHPTTTIQQTALDRVFQIINESQNPTTITFENLVIEDGQAQEDGGAGLLAGHNLTLGGGILDDGGNVTLTNVVLQKNSAKASDGNGAGGGGIYGESRMLNIQSSFIQANDVLGGSGTSNNLGGTADGGGIFALGQVSITHSTLSDNTVTGGSSNATGGIATGGGISAEGSLTITDSILEGNTVTGGSSSTEVGGSAEGGGVYYGSFGTQATATLTDCTVSGNTLTGGTGNLSLALNADDVGGDAFGGGVYTSDQNTVPKTDISDSILSGNTLTGGTGTLNHSSDSVTGDVGGEAQGGGVFAQGPTTITTSLLSGNTLSGGNGTYVSGTVGGSIGGSVSGGGLYVSDPNGTASVTASTLSSNTLTGGSGSGGSATPGLAQGGGAYIGGGDNTLVNSTIADNQVIGGQGSTTNAVASGGGLYFAGMVTGTPTTRLTNVTVADNKASLSQGGSGSTSGGGIDHEQPETETVIMVNSLVALNSASFGPDYAGSINTSSHNLIGNAGGSLGFSIGQGDLFGSIANTLNPQLGPLQNNGGPLVGAPGTQQVLSTIALLPGSPALHAGDPSAQSVTGPFDQRGQGFARVVNDTIDIGAFEVQSPSSPPPPPHGSSPTPKPPTLHTPALLALFDELLHGVETVNGNDTETVIDSLFGISLLVSTYDGAGNLTSVTLFGTNVTALFELA